MILLDTHTLLWWVNKDKDRLSAQAAGAIAHEARKGDILVSSISVWEISRLVLRGRIALAMQLSSWIAEVESVPSVRFVPVDNAVAMASEQLPDEFHRDPADRFIVATARLLDAPIVTVDRLIRDYPHVQTIW